MSTISTNKIDEDEFNLIYTTISQPRERYDCFWCGKLKSKDHSLEKCKEDFKQAILSLLKPRKR